MLMLRLGAGFILAAAAAAQSTQDNPLPPQRDDRWFRQGEAVIADKLRKLGRQSTDKAKNVILFVADGHGVTSNQATRLFAGQNQRAPAPRTPMVGSEQHYGEEHILPAEDMPNLALSKTYNTNAQTPVRQKPSRSSREKSFRSGQELTDCAAAGLRRHSVRAQHGRQDQGRRDLRAREAPAR